MRAVRVVSFKLPPSLLSRVERVANKMGVTKSELIRLALEKYLDGLEAGGFRPSETGYKRVVLRC